jgi:resuscitation-promoting factor RpfB
MADERIALSRHRTGTRSNRRKRGLIRRVGIVFPVTVFAVVAVIGVAVSAKIFAPVSGAFGGADALEAVTGSHTLSLLEAERAQLIAMTAAARTMTVVAKAQVASPAQVAAANPGTGSGTGGGGAGIVYVTSKPPDPHTAQSIAYNMMGSFGFSPTTYFGCLLDLWNRESNWVYDAENASGAYGIPQALPGSKMSSAGPDWQTNPATQIRWGLGYIKQLYGNPCNAWAFEERNGYY